MAHQPSFSEKELMNDLLMSEKQLSSAYTVGITESTCPNLRNVLLKCEQNVLQNQESIFQSMAQRGWYATKQASPQEVQNVKDQYNQLKSELK
ncbi:MAG TPA: spore coat protein [Clostridiales bacterium]|nr:spore coat protein [Clostridiales bacterium]